MKRENIKAFLDSLKTNPQAEELIRDLPEPETMEERIRVYAKIAAELGFDVSENDLTEYIEEKEKHLQNKTGTVAESMQELPLDELAAVAGGGDHPECKDTYKDKENCWVNDGCDIVNHHYDNYLCHYNDACNNENFTCGKEWYAKCGSYYYYGG